MADTGEEAAVVAGALNGAVAEAEAESGYRAEAGTEEGVKHDTPGGV